MEQALLLETVFPKDRLRILKQNINEIKRFTDQECLVLISAQFLCLFPHSKNQPSALTKFLPEPVSYAEIMQR